MKKMTRILLSVLLICTIAANCCLPAFAAATYFNAREIYGYEGKVYLTTKDTVVRQEPHNKGAILERLPTGYPLEATKGLYVTNKGTYWIKTLHNVYGEAWIYVGNLKEHSHHFVSLENYGGGKFEFCDGCGHIRAVSLYSFEVQMDNLQITLAALSLIPGIGNGFDVLDGLISLARGQYGQAAMSLMAAVPGLGYGANAAKVGDTLTVTARQNNLLVKLEAVDGAKGLVKVNPVRNNYQLKKHLDQMYDSTGDLRFYKLVGEGRTVAAHHIVAIGDKAAEEAANILMKLGIDLNGASNGVYLCMNSKVCDGSIHLGKHSNEYYTAVNARIRAAYNKGSSFAEKKTSVVLELDRIARDLMNGNLSL